MKKITSVLLTLALLLTLGISCPAAEQYENINNGSFEESLNGVAPSRWELYGTAWGESYGVTRDTTRPQDGTYVLRINRASGTVYFYQEVIVSPGAEYTLSYYARATQAGGGIAHKIEMLAVSESGEKTVLEEIDETVSPSAKWGQETVSFTPPEGTSRAKISFYCYSGDYSWDVISLMGPPMQEEEPVPSADYVQGVSENALTNAGFEELNDNGEPVDWAAKTPSGHPSGQSAWEGNTLVELSEKYAHSGDKSVKITLPSGGGSAWIRQTVQLKPNTRYQCSAWVRSENVFPRLGARHLRFYAEYYTGTPSAATWHPKDATERTFNLTPLKANRWEQTSVIITPTEGTVYTQVYITLYSEGTVWVDDLEVVPIEEEKKLELRADQYFYYPETETGYARTRIFDEHKDTYADGTVDFVLYDKDGETVLKEQLGTVQTDSMATFDFPISLLAEKKTAYPLVATLRDSAGNVVDESRREVHCYDRPTDMSEDGWLLNEDGSAFVGTMTCHANTGNDLLLDDMQRFGINLPTVSSGAMLEYYYTDGQSTLLKTWLDQLHARGMKGLVSVYQGGLPSSHPEIRDMVVKAVTDFKDHPAVAGWCVSDEPFDMLTEPERWLLSSYKLIRDIDDRNGIFFVDNSDRAWLASAYSDVVGYDPYPSYPKAGTPIYEAFPTCGNNPAAYTGETTAIIRRMANRYGKGMMVLNASFDYNGYYPKAAELRSFFYQAIFEGAHNTGWYCLGGSERGILTLEKEGDTAYADFLTEFNTEEQLLAYDLFGRDSEYPLFNIYESHHAAYKGVVKDGDLYLLIINRRAETQEISVPLVSQNGLLSVGCTPKELYLEGESVNPTVNGTTLTVTIPAANVSVLRFECAVADASKLSEASFDDIADYAWAAEAIENLYRKDILTAKGNRTFAPGETVTRGDFAKYLIRALDLEVMTDRNQMVENFADVPEDADYYREVRVGKTLGILRGTGDNSFNPEEPITRQDLLVICARGLREAFKATGNLDDLGIFTDASAIAGYAQNDVALMSAMDVVEGNEDGTLNPEGHTTRAEAAVIMQRIYDIA